MAYENTLSHQELLDELARQKAHIQKLEALIDIGNNLSQGICLVAKDTERIVYVNPRMEKMFGYSLDELFNKPSKLLQTADITIPDNPQPLIRESLNIDGCWQGEFKNMTKDGHVVWSSVDIISTTHPQFGAVWMCVYTNISQQKLAEEKSHNQSQLLDFVLDAVVSGDLDFNIQSWNRAAEVMYGWTEEEVLGCRATDLFRTQYFDDSTPEDIQRQYRASGTWRGEMIHHRQDGTPIPVTGTSAIIYNTDGEPVGSVAVLRDISDKIEAEQTLKASEERHRIISELMSDYAYLYHINDDGDFYRVWTTPQAFKRVTGYYRDEIRTTYGLYHPDEIEYVKRDVERTIQGENTEGEYRIITKEGQDKWIYLRRRVIWDKDQQRVTGFYGAGQDITARKLAESRTIDFNKEKERVNILQNFIRDASHDLKTPLSTVNTSIYLLRNNTTDENQQVRINKLEFHIKRLTKLIEDMFEMSRLDLMTNLSSTIVDVNIFLRDIVAVHQQTSRDKNVDLHADFYHDALFVRADISTLGQAIAHLINNAIYFTPENGQITLRSYQEHNTAVIEVTDNGIGILAEELPVIFDRFYRGDKSRNSNQRSSTGLGLSIARKIIELHKGTIEVESKVGVGSTFTVRLPLNSI